MKKALYLLIFLLPLISFSQTLTLQSAVKRCATFEVLENFRKAHPGAETDAQFETWLAQKLSARTSKTAVTVTLPVVFHIIHSNETEGTGTNISQALIQQQILQLNKDYANLSNSPYAVAANTNIQFALAQTNPGGTVLTQPGIDRIYYASAGFTAPPYTVGYANAANNYLTNTIKPATIWDPNRYVNIWVLTMETGILGIATFPTGSGLTGLGSGETATTAGVAILGSTVGSVFNPSTCGISYGKGKTLTHELGHFFGLRHIWGDATCGDDYCGDTPVHQTSNSGVPTHPKPNSCGTADEMFENYMDYSDDIILNTFTADQAGRMQTVLTNSPRRNTLATSTAGLVAVTATNRISFIDCTGALLAPENATSGTYPRYRDVSLNLNVEDKATGAATVTVNTAGTAVAGVDYQLLTPTVIFASGDAYKPVNIRLIDNVKAEGNRTIVVSYTISGAGVTAGSSAQTVTVTIQDNDDILISQGTATLFAESFEGSLTGWAGLGFSSATPANTFTISTNGDAGGSGGVLHVTNDPSLRPNTYTKTVVSASGIRLPLLSVMNLSNATLNFKYKVYGQSATTDFGRVIYATESAPSSYFFLTSPIYGSGGVVSGTASVPLTNSTFMNNKVYLGFYWANDASLGNDPPLNVDDLSITADGTNVETAVSSSYGYDVQSGSGINNFRSTNNKAIARLTNLSANIYGVTAAVTQAGSGQVSITTNKGSFQRTQKVFQITPDVSNNSVSYRLTLYFTPAELSVWGANSLNLKVMKVNDGASLGGLLNSSNATLYTPVSATQDATAGVIAYTVDVTGGFSQFMLVSPNTILPVGLITFEARPEKKNIVLSWKTATERSNRGFAVERSTNGADFTEIGWVNGRGTTDEESSYTYTDNFVQPNTLYYYRLKQIDFDNRSALSTIRQAKLTANGVTVVLSPNPAKEKLTVFAAGSLQPVAMSLVNAKGQTVSYLAKADLSRPYTLDVSRFAKGYYTLVLHFDDGDAAQQFLLQ